MTPEAVRALGRNQLLWVDVERGPDDETVLERVADVVGLADAHVQRIGSDVGRARLTRAADRIHLTLEALEEEDDGESSARLVRREIDLIAAPNLVLTVHAGRVEALHRFRDGLDGETRLGKLAAGDLLSSLVDEVFVGYFLVAEMIERDIDALDGRALHGQRGDDVLGDIVTLRRRIAFVRRTLAPHRDALSTLAMPEMRVAETVGQPWPGLVDRLEGAMAAVESLRDSLLGTFDIYMGRVSQRANDVMRTLTLLSAVLLPAVVLAGVMGMNFKLPFFDESANFWVIVAGMGGLAILILGLARWRRWI
ncbi:MAG: magnesium transporter CorA family protein [Candidatus Limnocylindrales bacterium]